VFIYIKHPKEIIDKLILSLKSGGRLIIVMLNRQSDYVRYSSTFRNRILENPERTAEITWQEIGQIFEEKLSNVLISNIDSTVSAPSLDDFLSISDFIFNHSTSDLPSDIEKEAREYLSKFQTKEGFKITLGHKLIVGEK
jgi:hypothetical protein